MVRLTLIARVRDGLPLAEGLDSDKDHDLDKYKQQAKVRRHELPALKERRCVAQRALTGCRLPADRPPPRPRQTVFKRLAQMSPSQAASRVSIESDAFVFHYLIEAGVCYLTLTDRGYPKKLAYQYLEELQSEFSRLYGPQIEGIARPYAFIKFGAGRGRVRARVRPPAGPGAPTGRACRAADTFIQKTKKLYLDTRTQRNIAKLSEDLNEVHSIMTRNIAEVLGQGERLDRAYPPSPDKST